MKTKAIIIATIMMISIASISNVYAHEDLTVNPVTIQLGQSVTITYNTHDSPTTISSITVVTPTNNACIYTGSLPITVPPNSSVSVTYPTDFTGTGCDTNTIGQYDILATTTTGRQRAIFFVSFNVVPETIIGAIAAIATPLAVLAVYKRR